MTLAEAQTARTNALAAYNNILAGGVKSYEQRGGGASVALVKLTPTELLDQIAQLDALIDRIQNGTFAVVQFRKGAD